MYSKSIKSINWNFTCFLVFPQNLTREIQYPKTQGCICIFFTTLMLPLIHKWSVSCRALGSRGLEWSGGRGVVLKPQNWGRWHYFIISLIFISISGITCKFSQKLWVSHPLPPPPCPLCSTSPLEDVSIRSLICFDVQGDEGSFKLTKLSRKQRKNLKNMIFLIIHIDLISCKSHLKHIISWK